MIGQQIAHYQIRDEIGEGGMGVVYRARDTRLDRDVALKFLSLDFSGNEELKERFLLEARAASRLDHPNICTVHAIEETDEGRLFIDMAYYEGRTAKAKLKDGPLPWPDIVELAVQIANGLQAAHEQGVIHMDVKPANLMVTQDGTVKILDFGLSRFTSEMDRTRPKGPLMGTVAYMSPEQVQNEVTGPESDIWALGVVLYEMATGARPFHGKNDMSVLYAIVHRDAAPPIEKTPELPAELDRVIRRMLTKDRRQRYQSAEELLAALEPLRQNSTSVPTLFSFLSPESWRQQTRWQRAGTVSFLTSTLAVVLLLGWALANSGSTATNGPPPKSDVLVLDVRDLSGGTLQNWIGPALAELMILLLPETQDLRLVREEGERLSFQGNPLVSYFGADGFAGVPLVHVREQLGAEWVLGGDLRPTETVDSGSVCFEVEVRVQSLRSGGGQSSVSDIGCLDDLPALTEKVAKAVAPLLGMEIPSPDTVAVPRTPHSEAQRLLAEARAELRVLDAKSAKLLLEKAMKLDPGNALIHAFLAEAFSQLGNEALATREAADAVAVARFEPYRERVFIQALSLQLASKMERSAVLLRALHVGEPTGDGSLDNDDLRLRLAKVLTEAGQREAALTALEPLRARLPNDPRVALADGEALTGQSLDLGREAFVRAAALARHQGSPFLEAEAIYGEALALVWLGDLAAGVRKYEICRQIWSQAGFERREGDALIGLGMAQKLQNSLVDAKISYQQAARLYGVAGMRSTEGRVLHNLANLNRNSGNLTAAIEIYNQARDIFGETNDWEALSAAHINMAEVYAATGRYDDAQNAYDTAGVILQDREHPTFKSTLLSDHVGNLLIYRGELAKAMQQLAEAQSLQEQLGDRLGLARTASLRGRVLYFQGDLTAATESLETAIQSFEELGDLPVLARSKAWLVEARTSQGRFEEAHSLVREIFAIEEQMTNPLWISEARLAAASLLLKEGMAGEAEVRAREALGDLAQSSASPLLAYAHLILARSLLSQERPQQTQTELDRAHQLLEGVDSPIYRIPLELTSEHLASLTGNVLEPRNRLEMLLAEATSKGLGGLELEIRLRLGELDIRAGSVRVGRSQLRKLAIEAGLKGFDAVAERARSLASTP